MLQNTEEQMNLQREHAQGGQQGMGSREAQVNHVSQWLLFHSLTANGHKTCVYVFFFPEQWM